MSDKAKTAIDGATIGDIKPIKTHSSAIQMTHKMSLVQHKAWLILLRNAYHELHAPGLKKHKIRLSELATYLGYTSNRNDRYLKNLLEELVDTKVTWNLFSKDGDQEWGVAALLAGCKVKKGVVEYDYSSFLREKLYNPSMFALLNLRILNQFRSKYSLALYNLCKDYIGVGRTPYIELDKFREFVGLDEGEYADFKSMNRRVIKEPLKEINSLSDLQVDVEYTRERRKVAGLRFLISKNPQMKLDIESITEQVMNKPFESDETPWPQQDPLLDRLVSFGLTEKKGMATLEAYPRDYIEENLDIVEKELRAGKVKNVAAYAVAALRDDFRPRKTFANVEQEKGRKKTSTLSDRRQGDMVVRKLFEDFEIESIEEALVAMSPKERKKIEEEFLKADIENKKFVLDYYRQGGFDNIVVRGAFYAYVKERLPLSGEVMQVFVGYLKKKGYEPAVFGDALKRLEAVL